MSVTDAFKHWNSLCKEFEEMKPPTEQIYYVTFNYKAQSIVETINLTINLKHKKVLENE